MQSRSASIAALFAQARADLAENRLSAASLDALEQQILATPGNARQRLLYLHASSPSIRSTVIAAALHEPARGSVTQIDPLAEELPYASVFDAILEGWRVIHFPDQRAPFEDREIDIPSYEFILEKMETYDASS